MLTENCFVNIDFNEQGFPITKSLDKNYVQGKNIKFWNPKDGKVARFGANANRANLDCNRDPTNSKSFLKIKDEIASLGITRVFSRSSI